MTTILRGLSIFNVIAFSIYFCPTATSKQTHTAQRSAASAFAHEMMQSMAKMDRGMMVAPMRGDPDHDFAAMMIPHHQGAVDMARAVLLHGKDPVLLRLAQEIIVTQQQEIEVMRLRLAAMKAGAPRSGVILSHIQSAPGQKPGAVSASLPVSSHDRVYTADQTSNTVSVIDPATNTLLGVIRLGDPVPGALSPRRARTHPERPVSAFRPDTAFDACQ